MKKLNQCFARLLIDNHITDLRPEFMSRFSAEDYVRNVKAAGVESAMVYACDHNGNCYYPTQVGHMHAGLQGKDAFGMVVELLCKENIVPIAYYTATYHNDCAKRFPHAAVVDASGKTSRGRYAFTCPNQPDAEAFYKEQIREVLQYPVAGIFIDMTFWPAVCYCDACRNKYGAELPVEMNWDSPEWVRFQRFREKSMADFGLRLTDWVRSIRPDITVVHQFSPVLHGWGMGQASGIAAASDYASGDFYGSKLQQRFAVKAFDAYTSKPPFEFMTSRCVSLRDHTSTKSDEELFLSALTTLANGGAYFFIDAINPDGTLESGFYQRLGDINRRLIPFRNAVAEFQGHLAAETAIYFSMPSCVERHLNGVKLVDLCEGRVSNMQVSQNAILGESLGAAEVLNRLHVPWKILTDVSTDFAGLKTIIVNNAAYLSEAECSRLRQFVAEGGTLIAGGITSLYNLAGETTGNFALSDVFGVDFTGEWSGRITYTSEELVLGDGEVPLVNPHSDTVVRSYLTFPDFPVGDPVNYASIHSNPPGDKASAFPAVTLHQYGKGQALWLAAPIALKPNHTQTEFLKRVYGEFLGQFLLDSSNLPESAEVTVLKNGQETMLAVVNQQDAFPVIPLCDVTLKIKLADEPAKVIRISDQQELPVDWRDGVLTLTIPKLHYGEMFRLQ